MDLSRVHFTEEDVQDFMDTLNIDTVLKNIDKMPSDEDYESSFSHGLEFSLNDETKKDNFYFYKRAR